VGCPNAVACRLKTEPLKQKQTKSAHHGNGVQGKFNLLQLGKINRFANQPRKSNKKKPTLG